MKLNIFEKADPEKFEKDNWFFPESLNGEINYFHLGDELFDICKTLEGEGKIELSHNVALLAHLLGMGFRPDEVNNPFKSFATWEDGSRTIATDDFTENHLLVFRKILERTNSPAIKARVADVLWIMTKPAKRIDAELAIQSYIALSVLLRNADVKEILYASYYLKRAIQIWLQLGGDEKVRLSIQKEVEACMKLDQPEPPNFTRFFFYELIPNILDSSDTQRWIELGEKLLAETIAQKEFEKARSYLTAMRLILRAAKDEAGAIKMVERKTDMFVYEAREMKTAKAGPMILQHLYNKAIEACRNTKGKAPLSRELHKELLEVQKEIPGTLSKIHESVDLQPAIEQMVNLIREKDFKDAMKVIALKSLPQKKDVLFKEAEDMMASFPLQSLFTTTIIDEKGKVVARRPGMSTSPEEKLAATRSRASQNLLIVFEIKGIAIGCAQREVNNRVDYDELFFDSILYPNPFVPVSRVHQFKRGLVCGLRGDWISSICILVPLLENSLRTVMQIAGHNMTSIDAESIQKEKDLNAFIYSEELASVVGADMQFQLQVLLCDKAGLNLRNQVAHGLMTDGVAYSGAPAFVWALSLLLCISFQERYFAVNVKPEVGDEEADT